MVLPRLSGAIMQNEEETGWKLRAWLCPFAVCVLTTLASAAPIKYQLTIPNAVVQLGTQVYSNVPVTFTLISDDTKVVSGTTPSGIPGVDIAYSVIYQGSASVSIGAAGPAQVTANFSPNVLVLNIDHRNEGIGFGFVPNGVGSGGFDVTQLQPIYPGAISDYAIFSGVTQTQTGWRSYDLTLGYAQSHTNISGGEFHADGSVDIQAAVYSCNQFNGTIYYPSCAAPAALPTNLGMFTINMILEPTLTGMGNVVLGEFTAAAAPAVAPAPPAGLSVTTQ